MAVGDLSNVYNAVYDARVKWYEIGMVLSVDIVTLDSISVSVTGADKRLRKMLQEWLQNGKDKTWKALSEALRNRTVAHPDIQTNPKLKFCWFLTIMQFSHN